MTGVKSVLQEKDRLGGIVGAVSEHLTFDVRYQTLLDYNDFVGRIGIGRVFRGTVKVGDQVTPF